jgi:beta-glucanase (GH16 family)
MSTPDPINDSGKRSAVIAALVALVVALATLFGGHAIWPENPAPEPTPTVAPSSTPLAPSWPQTGIPKLTFSDEFDGLGVDTNKWERGWFAEGVTNGVNANNLNCYDTTQVSQHDGMLHLTVVQRQASCNGGTRQYVSGLVNSRPRGTKGFQQQFGSFEARVCLSDANSDGLVDGFPAWWTNGPSNVSWPEHGEIDAVEGIGGRTKASLHYITSTATGTAYGSGTYSATALIGCHNFGFAWTATDVTFYYDGVKFYAHAFRGPYPQYLILNYALRSTEQTIVGSEVAVDWVRVWQ